MKCDQIREMLESYICEDVSPDQSRIIENHIKLCAACAKELEALNKITNNYADIGNSKTAVEILEKINHEQIITRANNEISRQIVFNRLIYAAATVLIVVPLTLVLTQKPLIKKDNIAFSSHKLLEGTLGYLDDECRIVKLTAGSQIPVDTLIDNLSQKKATIQLDDGSTVWIAPRSFFNIQPTDSDRNFNLILSEGKVQCKVTKNPNKFHVISKAGQIEVMGTEFVARVEKYSVIIGSESVFKHTLGVMVLDGNVELCNFQSVKDLKRGDSGTSAVLEFSGVVKIVASNAKSPIKPIVLNFNNYSLWLEARLALEDDEDNIEDEDDYE